ncbi:methyltransferase [Streptomyces bobili]|uniref:methyltransferase n=1 Tax=Streptomyces bobili TaxID=67280 RepID=UPI0036FFBBEC
MLNRFLPSGTDPAVMAAMRRHCRPAHGALMVFPRTPSGLRAALTRRGYEVTSCLPSTVVRRRFAERHGLPDEGAPVTITHADRHDGTPALEVFSLPQDGDWAVGRAAVAERAQEAETHIALDVPEPDDVVLRGLVHLLTHQVGFLPDGGGVNPAEGTSGDGRTVLYFRSHGRADPLTRRLEITCEGAWNEVLTEHTTDTRALPLPRTGDTPGKAGPAAQAMPASARPGTGPNPHADGAHRHLLALATGAWTTQALAAMAELRIAEHLHGGTATSGELATATGAHPQALTRLLAYLATLGLLDTDGHNHTLTDAGRLLNADHPATMRDLALLYAGPFYRSWSALTDAVRTGRQGFEHVYGRPFFEHAADHPEIGALFDRAMACGRLFFDHLPTAHDFTRARTVVDVAGGDGSLLAVLLQAHPHLKAVLAELPAVIGRAHTHLQHKGLADRCTLIPTDILTEVPSGGDIYLLSRVLHDWDDERCVTILRACRTAIADSPAPLLILERLLPGNPHVPSLARPWDIHMLVNNGAGRERTEHEYRTLLGQAGFRLRSTAELPLDVHLIVADPCQVPD